MFKLPISPHRSGTGCVPSLGTNVCIFNLRVAWLYVLKTWVGVQEGLKSPFRIVMRWIDSWPYNGAGGEALRFYISQISYTIQAFLFWLPFLKIIDMVSWPRSYCGWQHVDNTPRSTSKVICIIESRWSVLIVAPGWHGIIQQMLRTGTLRSMRQLQQCWAFQIPPSSHFSLDQNWLIAMPISH